MKYVVLFDGLGQFSRGDVIEDRQLPDGQIDRLLGMEAMRPANDMEAKEKKVEVVAKVDSHATYETRLAEKDRQIADLKVKIAQLEAECQALKAAVEPKKTPPPSQSAVELLAEKEKQIKQLQAEVKNKK